MPVDAGVAVALVDLREAGGIVVTLRTDAGEVVDAVLADATIVTGVGCTFVDVDVAHGSYKPQEHRRDSRWRSG